MLYLNQEIINHMEADELRNILCHVLELNDRMESLVISNNEMIELHYRLYRASRGRECVIERTTRQKGVCQKLIDDLNKKYEEYMPTPCIGRE